MGMITENNEAVINYLSALNTKFTNKLDEILKKLDKPQQEVNFLKQDLFEFFVNNHNLHLLDGEMNDIIHFVNSHYPLNIQEISENELYEIFNKVVEEINHRKAIKDRQGG